MAAKRAKQLIDDPALDRVAKRFASSIRRMTRQRNQHLAEAASLAEKIGTAEKALARLTSK